MVPSRSDGTVPTKHFLLSMSSLVDKIFGNKLLDIEFGKEIIRSMKKSILNRASSAEKSSMKLNVCRLNRLDYI